MTTEPDAPTPLPGLRQLRPRCLGKGEIKLHTRQRKGNHSCKKRDKKSRKTRPLLAGGGARNGVSVDIAVVGVSKAHPRAGDGRFGNVVLTLMH